MDDDPSDETDDECAAYDSGPFCRHWGDAYDCDRRCAACGVRCSDHHDVECPEWVEPE